MNADAQRIRMNAKNAELEDLLDRVTVYRQGMEPEAVAILEDELHARGVSWEHIQAHAGRREEQGVLMQDGIALPCCRCRRPAMAKRWAWHRIFGRIPIFPRLFRYCSEHLK